MEAAVGLLVEDTPAPATVTVLSGDSYTETITV